MKNVNFVAPNWMKLPHLKVLCFLFAVHPPRFSKCTTRSIRNCPDSTIPNRCMWDQPHNFLNSPFSSCSIPCQEKSNSRNCKKQWNWWLCTRGEIWFEIVSPGVNRLFEIVHLVSAVCLCEALFQHIIMTLPFKELWLETRTTDHPPVYFVFYFVTSEDGICIWHTKNTVVNTIYLTMLDYKHWSFLLKGNKPGNLAVEITERNVLQNKLPQIMALPARDLAQRRRVYDQNLLDLIWLICVAAEQQTNMIILLLLHSKANKYTKVTSRSHYHFWSSSFLIWRGDFVRH